MNKYGLRSVSDHEWLNGVPNELLSLYTGGEYKGSTTEGNHRFEKKEFSENEVKDLKDKYPEWFINNK